MVYRIATIKTVFYFIIVAFFLKVIILYFSPIIIALLLSIILQPFIVLIENKGIKKSFALIIVYSMFFIIFLTIGSLLLNGMYSLISRLIYSLPELTRKLYQIDILNDNNILNLTEIINSIKHFIVELKDKIFGLLLSTMNSFSKMLLILILALLFSYDIDKLIKFVDMITPYDYKNYIKKIFISIKEIIVMQLELVAISMIIVIMCFIILGIKNAFLLGFICAILDILPVIGPALVFIPLIIFNFIEGNFFTVIGLLLVYALNSLTRQLIEVRFFNSRFNLSPIITILSLYIGYIIYGYLGLIIGPIFYLILIEFLCNNYEILN